MTDQNNAAQAVQESERNAAVEEYFGHRTWIKPTASNFRLFEAGFDRAHALLSKLRAEGVQAGEHGDEARENIAAGLQDSAYCAGLQRGFMFGDHGDHEGLRKALESRDGYVKTIKDARAALASAPVAGEAQPVTLYQARIRPTWRTDENAWSKWEDCTAEQAADYERVPLLHDWQYEVRRLYTAPQASEAVPAVGIAREHELREIMAALILEYEDEGITAQTLKTARDAIYRPYQNAALSMQTQESRVGTNSGHGHVWDRPDGFRARCGGPGICFMCSADHARANTKQAAKDGAQSPANRPESRASIESKGGALDGGDCANGAHKGGSDA